MSSDPIGAQPGHLCQPASNRSCSYPLQTTDRQVYPSILVSTLSTPVDSAAPDRRRSEGSNSLVSSNLPEPPAPIRPATRADVARYAGVSTAVVSYVVNEGPRRVAPATAARVRAAIEILNYRPNVNARALKKGSTQMLGVVLPDITNPFFAEYVRAIEVAAADHGYVLVVATSNGDGAAESQIVSELADRHIDGLLLGTVRSPASFRTIRLPGGPTVLIDCASAFEGYAGVGADSREGARIVVDHLISVHGHQSVALIIGESTGPIPDLREQGWGDASQEHDLPPGPIVRTVFSLHGGYKATRRLLAWPTRPSAVFGASDQLCTGALKAIREAGLRCPEDIAVVSYDGTTESAYCWPPLTVARQPIKPMAEAAVSMVLNLTPADTYQRFDTELVVRESCGCARAAVTSWR
jgi:LacI family transcriptional regulator